MLWLVGQKGQCLSYWTIEVMTLMMHTKILMLIIQHPYTLSGFSPTINSLMSIEHLKQIDKKPKHTW